MILFKKILCTTDFSEVSFKAMRVSNDIALKFSSELYILHTIETIPLVTPTPDGVSFDVTSYQKELESHADKKLKKIIKETISDKVKVHPLIKHGDPTAEIIHLTQDMEIDIIVIASQGKTGWGGFLSGSVAGKVVKLAPCPVLTIPVSDNE